MPIDIIELFRALVLGIVQGIAEFAPISSSAHLIIVPWLFGWEGGATSSLEFDVALHLGTLGAVLIYFWRELWILIKAGFASIFQGGIRDDPNRKLAWLLVLGTIPAAVAGFLLEDTIDAVFHGSGEGTSNQAIIAIAFMLALFGLLMYIVERFARHERMLAQLSWWDSFLIGLAQTLALFPGVSRSGSTITAGMALGFKRDVAAKYAFLLSVPITLGGGLKGVYDLVQEAQASASGSSELLVLLVGILAAGVSGFLCIRFLLAFLRTRTTMVFVIYRWVLAAVVIAIALWRIAA